MTTSTIAFATTNADYAVIAWEPVAHSGERINVASITRSLPNP